MRLAKIQGSGKSSSRPLPEFLVSDGNFLLTAVVEAAKRHPAIWIDKSKAVLVPVNTRVEVLAGAFYIPPGAVLDHPLVDNSWRHSLYQIECPIRETRLCVLDDVLGFRHD